MTNLSRRMLVFGAGALVVALSPFIAHAQNSVTLSTPIGGVTSVTGMPQYVAAIYRFAIGASTAAAIIMVTYGGFLYLVGSVAADINTGKKIIIDAMAGLALVMGAYLILKTVNTATLTLRMPGLPIPINIPTPGPDSSIVRNVPNASSRVVGTSCSKDSDCGQGKCIRFGMGHRLTSDSPDGWYFDIADDNVHSHGRCGDQLEGSICRASETGIYMETDKYGRVPIDPAQEGAALARGQSLTLSTRATLAARVAETNNGGTGKLNCNDNLPCAFLDNDPNSGTTRGFYCVRPPATNSASPPAPVVQTPSCNTDADCNAAPGTVCITGAASGQGVCVNYPLAQKGQRCRCNPATCGLPRNTASPRVITGLSQYTMPCETGLVCTLFGHAGETEGDWVCAEPTPATTPTAPASTPPPTGP